MPIFKVVMNFFQHSTATCLSRRLQRQPGVYVTKHFSLNVTDEGVKYAKAFVPGEPLRPGLMYLVKARSLPWRGAP